MSRAHSTWRSILTWGIGVCLAVAGACVLVRPSVFAQTQAPVELSQTTESLVFAREWWPTSGTPPAEAYAGSRSCQQCHATQAATQVLTPMAHASYRSAVGAWGAKLTPATTHIGTFLYLVQPQATDSTVTVESGNQSTSAAIPWTFGAGVVGQTFILESKGRLYDSEITSFLGLEGGMDVSPAHKLAPAGDLEQALGENLTPKAAQRCFGCHTSNSTMKGQFDSEQAIPGIGCESCHGPGLAHVVAALQNMVEGAGTLISNPRSLNPVESVDFCGACHTTSADAVESKMFVPSNVRFPPYRLEKSMCWGVRGDQRLVCYACHDPHKPLVQRASFYDKRCLSCHNSHGTSSLDRFGTVPETCPKATANCTTCHMPKYYVPEMHAKFTDHYIRIVRPGEAYPVQ
ncbi:MAG TPA: multiheme c-type cytochrome [Silvibacterium sp.]|nr:multiheme c-type cytochrome [Silvibacterium sp.]